MKLKNYADYFQPNFYKFSEDSIALSSFITQFVDSKKIMRAIDLCAGCGVVGIELLNNFFFEKFTMDFCEIQQEFIPFIRDNLDLKKVTNRTGNIFNSSYSALLNSTYESSYDCIIFNPPYFNVGQGRLSPKENRNICRFFLHGSMSDLLNTAVYLSQNNGKIFFSARLTLLEVEKKLQEFPLEMCQINIVDVIVRPKSSLFSVSVLKENRS